MLHYPMCQIDLKVFIFPLPSPTTAGGGGEGSIMVIDGGGMQSGGA
jgi:hypothetical protein